LDAITDASGQRQWFCEEPLPAAFAQMPVVDSDTLALGDIDLVFTAVEAVRRALKSGCGRVSVHLSAFT
jgi:hypothetical protein